MSLKIKKLNKFDLIQNSKTIFNELNKSRKFADYPDQASRIYFNLKRSGLTPSEFSSETKIPKNIVVLLGSMKKPDGDYWPELQLKILEIDKLIEQNVKKYNDCVSLLENCPVECGYRKYSIDIVRLVFNISKNFNFLNAVGFDLAQFDNWNSLIQTTQIVEKDIKKAKKIKSQKIVQSFINDEVVVGIKNSIPNLDFSKIPNKLKIVEDYRKFVIKADNYSFKQFCIDCGLEDKFKSLNYYYLNYDSVKKKFDIDQERIAERSRKVIEEKIRDNEERIISANGAIGSRIYLGKNRKCESSENFDFQKEIFELKQKIEELLTEKLSIEGNNSDLKNQLALKIADNEILQQSIHTLQQSIYKRNEELNKLRIIFSKINEQLSQI